MNKDLWWRWQDLNLRPWDYDSSVQLRIRQKSGVFLRPKMYSLEAYEYHTPLTDDSTIFELQRLKGMSRSVVAKEIDHSQYIRCLESEIPKRHTMTIIKSRQHELYIEQLTKTSLSIFDDKRKWLSKYVSVPYGL